jgi:hypothetical protein
MNHTKFNLLLCLCTTKELLARSTNDGWINDRPIEYIKVIDAIINTLSDDNSKLPLHWDIQFQATGPIQEIAINNGWHNAYIELSKIWDSNHTIISKMSAQQGDRPEPVSGHNQ